MAIYAPKAAENVWFKAREKAMQFNDCFGSREGASRSWELNEPASQE